MQRVARRSAAVALVALAVTLSGSTCPGGNDGTNVIQPNELSGSYDLLSHAVASQPVLVPPTATGTLAMSASRYNVTLHISGQPDLVDSGTYGIFNGSTSVIHMNSDAGFGSMSGNVTFVSNILTLQLNTVAGGVVDTWNKN